MTQNERHRKKRYRRWASFAVSSAEISIFGDFDIPNYWQIAFGVAAEVVGPLS